MSKQLIIKGIERCEQCPWAIYHNESDMEWHCEALFSRDMAAIIHDVKSVPYFCPLPEEPKGGEG